MKQDGFTGNQLKLIAIVAMTIDHLTWIVFPGYQTQPGVLLLHCIGRLTAPTMCFFIAEGYHYTRDWKKYAARLFAFSVVSHFAYTFAFGIPFVPFRSTVFNQTSVMWSLAWGLVALAIMDSRNAALKPWMKNVFLAAICVISFCSDWSCIAVLVIVSFGTQRGQFKKQAAWLLIFVGMYALVYILFIDVTYGILQMAVALALPLLKRYNGRRGSWRGMKWFFYIYYPAHLILIGLLRIALGGSTVMIGG